MNVVAIIHFSPHTDFIHSSFKQAGFLVVEEDRPLKVRSFISLVPFNPCLFAKLYLRR
jgi:hypothetical protein